MKSFDYPVIFQSWKSINFTSLFYRPGKSFYFITLFLGLECCIIFIIFKTWNSLEYGKSQKMIHNFLFDKRIRNTSLIYCLRLFESKLLIYGPEKVKKFPGKGLGSKTV